MSALLYFLMALVGTPATLYVAQSWAPDEFTVNSSTYVPNDVWNATYPRSVERMDDENILMDSSTTAVFSSAECTQYFFEFTPVIKGEADFFVRFRTTRRDYVRETTDGIEVLFRRDSMVVSENDSVLAVVDSVVWNGRTERLLIESFANDWRILKGCKELARGTTARPATDGVVVGTSAHTCLHMRNVVRNLAEKWWNKKDATSPAVEKVVQRPSVFNLSTFRLIR